MTRLIIVLGILPLLRFGDYAIAVESNVEAKKEQEIPLSEILTTSQQKGMLHSRDVFPRKASRESRDARIGYFRQVQGAIHSGASNVFLVDAGSVQDAIRASTRILLGSRAARTPATVDVPNSAADNYWIVAYLGAGPSEPTWWTVERVTVQGNTMRVAYRESLPTGSTRDVHSYYYWIPVGDLETGTYELELYDARRRLVTLMRHVEVEANNK